MYVYGFRRKYTRTAIKVSKNIWFVLADPNHNQGSGTRNNNHLKCKICDFCRRFLGKSIIYDLYERKNWFVNTCVVKK